MRRTLYLLAGLCVLTAGLGSHARVQGAGAGEVLRERPPGNDAFRFEMVTPPLEISPGSDGFADVRVETFRTRDHRPGRPDLPRRTVLVAIPPGATPRLEFTAHGETRRQAIPRPVPLQRDMAAAGADSRIAAAPDRGTYEGRRVFPEVPAWLGSVGVLRDQRYVEVHLAPVRFDAAAGGLLVHDRLELTVRFDGGLPTAGDPPVDDVHFEPVYRSTLANYEQGRRFRLGSVLRPATRAPRAPAAPTAVAGATPRRRILVRDDGMVRIEYAELQAAGFDAHPISTWRLTHRGAAIPMQVGDDGDDTLEPGEWVRFYGQILDHEPEAVLHTAPDLFAAADFTDESTYFLEIAGVAQAEMSEADASPSCGGCTPPAHFEALSRLEVDDAWRPLGGADPWYWSPSISAAGTANRFEEIDLPGLFSATEPAQVRVGLRGLSPFTDSQDCDDPDHLTAVRLRDCPAGDCSTGQTVLATDPGSFDGRVIHVHDFTWTYPGSGPGLTELAEVEVEALPLAVGGCANSLIPDFVEITYRRAFTALGDALVFDYPDGDEEFEVSGLVDPSPEVYEITEPPGGGPVTAVRLTGATVNAGTVRFRMDDTFTGAPRRFLVVGSTAVTSLPGTDFVADTISDLKLTSNQADYIVIAHPDTVLDPATCPGTGCQKLTDLLTYRATAAGGSLSSRVVWIQDVYDEFGDGLPGPDAIKNFLGWVLSTQPGEGWASPKPAFVLLLGDGTYDYKRGEVEGNYIPTQIMFRDRAELGYFTSDNLLAAVVGGDSLADLMLGRIPVRSASEADTVLDKILAYDQTPPSGDWKGRLLFVSDRGKTGSELSEAEDFEAINDKAGSYAGSAYTKTHLRYYPDYYVPSGSNGPVAAGQMNAELNAQISDADKGVGVVQFVGHGNWLVWSDDAYLDERYPGPYDIDSFSNGDKLFWMMAHNCLTGGFHYTYPYSVCDNNACSAGPKFGDFCLEDATCAPPDRTVGEDAVRLLGGGAVGVFSPSGLSFNYISDDAVDFVWEPVFGDRKERRIAIPIMETLVRLCTTNKTEACQNYVFLGDPALTLALPDVGPATAVVATGGNAQVTLDWTASTTTGATYDIYRINLSDFEVFYSKLTTGGPVSGNCSPGCSYVDGNVDNAKTYRYYVVAVDPDGFESRVSNFNTDCPGPGDCVETTPLNPNPPAAPGGVAVSDPGTGGHLDVSWIPNAESDIASYTVHWGTAPGIYGDSLQVPGVVSSARLEGLAEGQTYYVAVRATNTSLLTSPFSAEASDFPVFGPGLHVPDFIGDLRLDVAGNDVVLTWAPVTLDIYGKPISVVSYEVFRGSTPASLTLLGSSGSATFTDPGARTSPDDLHYWVRAVDAGGAGGAVGSELPASILALDVEASLITPGDLRLSWPAVTVTLDGLPLSLAHYAVYVSATPFSRQDIADGSVGSPLQVVSGTEIELTPPGGDQYYSVLAVDIRGNASPF